MQFIYHQVDRISIRSPFEAIHVNFSIGFSEQKCVETFDKANFFNLDDMFMKFQKGFVCFKLKNA